jgi:hypothetical protein
MSGKYSFGGEPNVHGAQGVFHAPWEVVVKEGTKINEYQFYENKNHDHEFETLVPNENYHEFYSRRNTNQHEEEIMFPK